MRSIFRTIKRSWSQHFVAQFSAVVIMTTTYTALLFIALSLGNIQKFFDSWGQVHRASVYWSADTKTDIKMKIVDNIVASPMIKSAIRVSSEQSATQFKKKFSRVSSQKLGAKNLSKYFPEYHVLTLEPDLAYKAGIGALEKFVKEVKQNYPQIKSVSYGKNWIDRYVGVLMGLKTLGWFLIVAFLLAALVVSSNVIKTILYSKRDEIEILEFVGAGDSYIYLPQIINASIICIVSFLSGLAINFVTYYQVKNLKSSVVSPETLQSLEFVSPAIWSTLFILSVLSVTLYSGLTIFNLLPRRKKALILKEVIR